MSLVQEFHSDHQKVVGALLGLRQAIATRDQLTIRAILEVAENFVERQSA
jgi:hypothetical protein